MKLLLPVWLGHHGYPCCLCAFPNRFNNMGLHRLSYNGLDKRFNLRFINEFNSQFTWASGYG